MRRRGVATGIVIVLLVAVFVLFFAPRKTPSGEASAGPEGTLALRRLLHAMGTTTFDGNGPPPSPGTFLLLTDLRNESEAHELVRWVERGGRLVVADPQSLVMGALGVQAAGRTGGFRLAATIRPGCVAATAVGVRDVEVAAADPVLSGGAGAVPCFPVGGGAYEIDLTRGAGTIVLLGGSSPLTNAYLSRADDATFALRLLGPGPVVFGSPLPSRAAAGGAQSVWAALPGRARAAILALAAAALLLGVARARRLGRPVLEDPLAPIPAGELVHAAAGLYRRGREVGFAGRLLRRETAAWLGRRLGAPGATPENVATLVAARSVVSVERAEQALLGPDPVSDGDLISLARELEELRRDLEGVPR